MIEYITKHSQDFLAILGAIYVLATAIAVVTPSDKDNTFIEKIGYWADRIGLKIKGK